MLPIYLTVGATTAHRSQRASHPLGSEGMQVLIGRENFSPFHLAHPSGLADKSYALPQLPGVLEIIAIELPASCVAGSGAPSRTALQ